MKVSFEVVLEPFKFEVGDELIIPNRLNDGGVKVKVISREVQGNWQYRAAEASGGGGIVKVTQGWIRGADNVCVEQDRLYYVYGLVVIEGLADILPSYPLQRGTVWVLHKNLVESIGTKAEEKAEDAQEGGTESDEGDTHDSGDTSP